MSVYLDPVTQQHIERVVRGLQDEFRGVLSVETIERYLSESLDQLGGAASTCSCPCSPTASHVSA
jgi:hypothetical protein